VSAAAVLRDPSLADGAELNAIALRPPPRASNGDDDRGGTDYPNQK
jgi:hypothetical protein